MSKRDFVSLCLMKSVMRGDIKWVRCTFKFIGLNGEGVKYTTVQKYLM